MKRYACRPLALMLLAFWSGIANAQFGLEQWLAAMSDGKALSVEDALALLPGTLRSDYVLVFASRSLQSSSFAAPRAILYGPDARFVVSFNGSADQRGFDAIETMEFEPRTSTFHFREISFAGAAPVVSADNPARCAACHGRPARPIWDSPPLWPGAYGERYRAGLSGEESTGIKAFLTQHANDARYRNLVNPRRFADRDTYVGSAHGRYMGDSSEPPNARFGSLLAAMQERALVAGIVAEPGFGPFRYALIAAADGSCGDAASYLTPAESALYLPELAAQQAVASPAGARQAEEMRARRASTADGYRAGFAAADLTAARVMAETLAGVPVQRWGLALDGRDAGLTLAGDTPGVADLLAAVVSAGDAQLRAVLERRRAGTGDSYCEYLRHANQQVLVLTDAARAVVSRPPVRGASADAGHAKPGLVARCAACHTGEVGPRLPFDDDAALGIALHQEGYPRGRLLDEVLYRLTPAAGDARMPRGIPTTATEQAELEAYFMLVSTREAAARPQ